MIAMFQLGDTLDRDEPLSANGRIQVEYVTDSVLPMLTDGGAWIAPGPSPLGTEEILETFKQILGHENYRGQSFQCPNNQGDIVAYNPTTDVVTITTPNPITEGDNHE